MKPIAAMVAELRAQQVHLWIDNGAVRFRGPKAILTPELMATLKARKAELLTFLREHEAGNTRGIKEGIPLLRTEPGQPRPVSFAQERMWFLHQVGAPPAQLNQFRGFFIDGPLRIDILEQCLMAIEQRHHILRTTLRLIDGALKQVVSPSSSVRLSVVDLQHSENPTDEVERAGQEIAEAPFDLEAGPLWRVRLLRLGSTRFVLLAAMHHIICDGWSTGVFWRELATLYSAFVQGRPSPLPELPIQYADFAAWQRSEAWNTALAPHLQYWQKQLSGAPPLLELPTDRPRSAVYRHDGRLERFGIPSDLTRALEELGRHSRATLFMVLHAAFSVLLSRLSGDTDILIATPIANRTRPELEPVIGVFINNVVLRADLSDAPSFITVLERVRKAALDGYAHQDAPFEQVLQALRPPRDPSYPPLAQVMFNLQNVSDQPLPIPGLTVTPMETAARYGQFLSLEIKFSRHGLAGAFDYHPDLFDAATIRRLAGYFQTLLAAIAASPAMRVTDLPLLPDAEVRRLVIERNATHAAPAEKPTIHALFEEQAAQRPDMIAVRHDDVALTYRELNRRANVLAHQLRAMGVGPGTLVGLCASRSLELVVGLLGILKAGGAYVALDPSLPKARLTFLLEDAEVAVLLTHRELLSDLPATLARVVFLDDERVAFRDDNPDSSLSGDDLAYVNYTSGSTGKPKGVQISHRALVNFLASMRDEPGLNPGETLLAVTTISFDIAALELYLPLIVGGTVVLASREAAANGVALMALLRTSATMIMQATPATWRMLIAAGWEGDPRLKVLCGGEALPHELAEQLADRCGSLWNMYGPTETTVWSAVRRIVNSRSDTALSVSEPIGGPIANTQLYILDRRQQLAPMGVAGELHIGGVGLARGYWRRPELTSEKFVPDPFSVEPGARLYKTGDLVRILSDDTVEFLGRTDHQVKLRGFRIELGEIESALGGCVGVRQGIVTVREDRPGDKRLVAYVTQEKPTRLSSEALRSYLKERLPDYMLPAMFVFVDHLPLTPNGKIDRTALPAPDAAASVDRRGVIEPEGAVEKTIVDIWRRVLAVERISVHDNFFEIGGHSILLGEVYVHLQKQFQKKIEITDLFRYPTISTLARFMGGQDPLVPVSAPEQQVLVAKQRDAIRRQQEIIKRSREAHD